MSRTRTSHNCGINSRAIHTAPKTLIGDQNCHEQISITSPWHQYQDPTTIHTTPKSFWCELDVVTNTTPPHHCDISTRTWQQFTLHQNNSDASSTLSRKQKPTTSLWNKYQDPKQFTPHHNHSDAGSTLSQTPLHHITVAPTPRQYSRQTKMTLIRALQWHEHSSTPSLYNDITSLWRHYKDNIHTTSNHSDTNRINVTNTNIAVLWHQYQDNIHTAPKSLWYELKNVTNTTPPHHCEPVSEPNNNSHNNTITLIGS